MASPLFTIDVAHPPRPPDVVEEELLRTLAKIRNSPVHRVLKVVHGYGSSGRGGRTRETVRHWAFRRRRDLRAVIEGERYALGDPATQELRRGVGQYADADIGRCNPGITILWVK